MCTFCRNQLPLTEYSFNEENAVDRIFYGRTDVKKASAFLFYSEKGIVKNLIHKLKYQNQPQIGGFLGDWYGQILLENRELTDVDMVIPVPLHPRKLKKRGYNQVALFGETLANHLEVPFVSDILIKTANTRTQTRKRRILRWQESEDLYKVRNAPALSGKHLLLVDDVITTGATIEACVAAIKKASQVEVSVASMAVVP